MSVAARIGAFVAMLAVVFGLAWVVGTHVGPVGEPAAAHSEAHESGPSHVTAAVDRAEVPGVTDVRVDLATGALEVVGDRPVPEADVRAAVDEAGYRLAGP